MFGPIVKFWWYLAQQWSDLKWCKEDSIRHSVQSKSGLPSQTKRPSPPPRSPHCLNAWNNLEVTVKSCAVECREKLKRRLSYPKGTKAGLFRAFFQEFYALWVLYLNRMFLRYGPHQKTKNYTFTLSSCSCWIPQSWQRLKSQLLACVKRGWFYRKATRSLLLCLIFPFSQQLGTSWLVTFTDDIALLRFPVLFTFSWQCSLLQDQEDGL